MPVCDHFRIHARRRVDLWVAVRCPGTVWQRDGRIVDVGLGGACVQVGETLDPGTEVSIEIHAPTLWDPLLLAGTVAWSHSQSDPARMGICFEHRAPTPLFALYELLSAQAYGI